VRGGATIAAFHTRPAPCVNLILQSVAERGVRGGASVAAFLPRGAPCVTAWCAACWPGARGAATAVTSITCAPGAAAAGAQTAPPAAAISASTAESGSRLVFMGADLEPSSQAEGKFAQLCIRTVTLNHCCGSALYLCADPDPGSQTNMDPSGSGSCSDVRS